MCVGGGGVTQISSRFSAVCIPLPGALIVLSVPVLYTVRVCLTCSTPYPAFVVCTTCISSNTSAKKQLQHGGMLSFHRARCTTIDGVSVKILHFHGVRYFLDLALARQQVSRSIFERCRLRPLHSMFRSWTALRTVLPMW